MAFFASFGQVMHKWNCIASCLRFAATPQSPRPLNGADSDDDDDDRNLPTPQRRVPSLPLFDSGSIEDSSLVVRGTCACG